TDHGNIAVRAYHRGNHIFIEVEDDGRGIDYERVKQTAVEAGLVSADDAANLTERDLLDFLFHPGFSTAPKKTELAGRGVGLDVVTEVVRLDAQLGLERVEPVNGYYRMVIANVAGRQIGLVVEEVIRKDEIVIKSLGEYLRNVKMFPGSTIAPDGSLILLIDVN